jgi:halimadienyl-diphosphate synthase
MEDFSDLLKKLGNSQMSHSAYDTAWVARLDEFDSEMSNRALRWISRNQLLDGSWGSRQPLYYHDRLICTLSCMIALTHRGRRATDKMQIDKGIEALGTITAGATHGLMADRSGETVGFELIVPTLVAEAEQLGLIKQQKERILGRLSQMRDIKMKKLAGYKISRFTSISHSAEMTGKDKLDLLDIDNLQETNGSVGNSPSASAHFALYVKPGDESALNYLRSLTKDGDGGVQTAAPIEIFERIWVLWNLSLTNLYVTNDEIKSLCAPHLDYIESHWQPGRGLSFSESFTALDGDDTSVGFEVLSKFGRHPDLDTILNYEEENWFRCYEIERDPSLGANVHMLGALRQAGYDKNHPSIQKILNFIRSMRQTEGYWLDKWNISPYYITTHIIILCRGYDNELCQEAVNWVLSMQQDNGSWGSYGFQSAEETAFCIQALKIWQIYQGKDSNKDALEKARQWLSQHAEPPYPSFWTAKTIYCPEIMVKSAILSALILVEA